MAMLGCRRWFRRFALSWGVLQLVLPMALLFADAQQALSGTRRAHAHVEAVSSETCVPVHADECALCRFMSNGSTLASRADFVSLLDVARTTAGTAQERACAGAARGLPESRAPPVG
jgi:hypothetical protein